MRKNITNDILTIYLEGRIDSASSEAFSSFVNDAREGESYRELVLDAGGLEYVSSAGLRVILRLRKEEPTLRIIGASPEVYEIFDMTGFSEMIPIEKAFRRMSVDGCEVIGQGAKGTVYRLNDDTIIKVYKNPDSLPDIKNERELARKAFILGIPTAISYDVVRVGDSYGSVFELLNAESFSTLISEEPQNIDKYVRLYAELLRKIHSTTVSENDMPDIKITVRKWLETDREYLPAETFAKVRDLIEAVPDTVNMLHCDYHTNNIMMQNGETLLIDMDTLSHGHPIFELANVHITYVGFGEIDPAVVENFLGLPYETAKTIWNKFLPIYLDTDDAEKIRDVENKAILLSCVRNMRHTIRRGGADTEEGRRTIDLCRENIIRLSGEITTLEF